MFLYSGTPVIPKVDSAKAEDWSVCEIGRYKKNTEKYGKEFGLGEITGIELDGESKGVLANAEYKKVNFDTPWYPGDDLQMAIGQSYNLFTPVQISNYKFQQ